jgi:intron-binding protein aquarius
MKQYAMNTVGVNKPSDYLDFGDTFLDQAHLQDSLKDAVIVKDDKLDESKRYNFKIRFTDEKSEDGSTSTKIEAAPLPHPEKALGNPVRFTPVQVEAIRSGLSPGLTLVVGPPGTGKTDVAVQVIASLYHTYPTQRTIIITHSNAALNDIFSKVMARGDVDERYFVRLGAGERDLETESSHDFTKIGRVAYSIHRRDQLLEQVQQLSESLGISGKAQRGPDGSPSYTCESAEYFKKHQIVRRQKIFESKVVAMTADDNADVTSLFPFCVYFNSKTFTLGEAMDYFGNLENLFEELSEYRPFELLRSQRQRADYLITKQARIVAMTCTHAAIARSNLIQLGFEYDNIVMEESGQMLEIESFIPCLLQKGKSDDSVSGLSRLKRVCMLGDHNQLPPVVKNASFSKYSNLDQSLFSRLIRLGVPYVQLDKQGRARPELMRLYRYATMSVLLSCTFYIFSKLTFPFPFFSWRYNNLGNLDHVTQAQQFQLANPGFVHPFQLVNVEDFEGNGETAPTPFYYQNLGEAEYVVALFQYMVLIGYAPEKISILTTYNGQKELISDIVAQRCGVGTPLAGVAPKTVSTVDQYQGQQNDIILLSLVRTKTVGHLRDIRRLIVAVSRARLGLYVFCRANVFSQSHELKNTMDQFRDRPNKLELVLGETVSPEMERKVTDDVPEKKVFQVEDVAHLGSIVHSMQQDILAQVAGEEQ